jgi:hypothetical protein
MVDDQYNVYLKLTAHRMAGLQIPVTKQRP